MDAIKMDAIKRLFGYVHVILGLAVAVQFLASEIYDDDAVVQVWEILNYLMAIGAVAALVFSYLRARDANGSDVKEWVGSSVMLIASAALFLLFFEQWFSWKIFKEADDELRDFRFMAWMVIDVMFVIMNVIVGSYLLRSTQAKK